MSASDQRKTKAQLIKELEDLRRRLAEAGKVNSEHKQAEELWGKSEFLHSVINSASEGIVVLDENANYRLINPASGRIMGYSAEDWLGKPAGTRIHPDDRENATSEFLKALRGESSRTEARFLGADGLYRTLDINCTPLTWAGKPHVIAMVTDVTERKRAEEALRESESHYRFLAENVTDVVWTVDMNLRATYVSPSVEGLLGYTVEETMTMTPEEVLPPTSFKNVMKILEEEIAGEREEQRDPFRVRTVELEVKCKDGSTIWTEVKASFLRDQNGQPIGIWGSGRDITERKQYEEKIKRLALYDQLTNLANRGLFYENLANALLRADRFKHFVFLLYLDLDGFKSVNDEFGHKAGDSVLIEVARRIQSCVRKIDTIARLGGDEFAIILSDIKGRQYVEDVVDRIIKSINLPIDIERGHCNIGASIGISIYPDDGPDADILLQKADAAMYKAKRTGKNNYLFSG